MNKNLLLKILIPLIGIVVYCNNTAVQTFMHTGLGYLRYYDFVGLREYLLSFGAMAPIVSVVLIVLQSIVPFFPGVVMTLTNAWLFGWVMGSLYCAIGATLGAWIDFYLGRWYGQRIFEYMIGCHKTEHINRFVKEHGSIAVLVLRLLPVVPYKMVSYSAGVSKIRFKVFICASIIGQMPAILLYSFLGENAWQNTSLLIVITLLFILAAGLLFVYRKNTFFKDAK